MLPHLEVLGSIEYAGRGMREAKAIHLEDELQLWTWGRVFVNRWVSPAQVVLLQRLAMAQAELIESVPDRRIAVFTVLAQNSTRLPSSDARKEAERIAKTYGPSIGTQAQVIEGNGFIAATARALLTGVNVAARVPYPVKVFAGAENSVPWFTDQLRTLGFESDGFGDVVRELSSSGWR